MRWSRQRRRRHVTAERDMHEASRTLTVPVHPSYYGEVGQPYRVHVMHPPPSGQTAATGLCVVGDAFEATWEHERVYHTQTIDLGDGMLTCIACGLTFYSQAEVN